MKPPDVPEHHRVRWTMDRLDRLGAETEAISNRIDEWNLTGLATPEQIKIMRGEGSGPKTEPWQARLGPISQGSETRRDG